MKHLVNMYVIELKKILSRKTLWISFAVTVVIIFIAAGSDLLTKYKFPDGKIMSGKEYHALARQKGELLSGRPIDDHFFEEVRAEVVQYALQAGYLTEDELQAVMDGTATDIMMNSVQTALADAAEETGCADAFGLIGEMTGDIRKTLTISSGEWYEVLERNLAWSTENTSGAEKEYWQKSLSNIEKPMTYYYAFGYRAFFEQMYAFIWILIILIAISLAGLFADERSTRMDALILSAKNGRETMARAKLLAGITVGVGEALLVFLLNAVSSFALYGANGKDGAIQLFVHGSAWNLTIRQAFWIFFVVTVFAGVFLSALVMLLSKALSSMQVIAVVMALFLLSFFGMPERFGVIAKLWNLRPNIILHMSIFYNSTLFGGRLNAFEMSIILYLATAIAAVIITGSFYKHSQVKG